MHGCIYIRYEVWCVWWCIRRASTMKMGGKMVYGWLEEFWFRLNIFWIMDFFFPHYTFFSWKSREDIPHIWKKHWTNHPLSFASLNECKKKKISFHVFALALPSCSKTIFFMLSVFFHYCVICVRTVFFSVVCELYHRIL